MKKLQVTEALRTFILVAMKLLPSCGKLWSVCSSRAEQPIRKWPVIAALCVALCGDLVEAQTERLPRIQPRPAQNVGVARARTAARELATAGAGATFVNGDGSSEQRTTDEWYLIRHSDRPVGYEHIVTSIIPAAETDDPLAAGVLLRRERESRLSLRRSGRDLSVSAYLATQEAPDGTLHKWTLRRTAGDGSLIQREGVWLAEDSAFEIREQVQATSRVRRVSCLRQPRSAIISAWLPEVARMSDRRFRLPVIFPETTAVADISFSSVGRQSMRLSDGQQVTVDRVEYAPVADPSDRTIVLIDADGRMLRSEQQLLGSLLELTRTDAATAVGAASLEALDLDLAGVISVRPPILRPGLRPELHLRVSLGPSDFLSMPQTELQRVRRISGHEAIVTLLRPVAPLADSGAVVGRLDAEAAGEYLARTRWIDPEDPAVQQLVRVVGTNRNTFEYCRSMSRQVSAQLSRSAFSTSLRPSSDVARTMSGDCTEAAVLLASMMRAARIPSRVVIGFVYVERAAIFAGHMWTEAYIDGSWIPFDATTGAEGVGVTHLRIIDSSLPDSVTSGTILFLPLLKFMGQAKITESTEGAE